MEFLTGVSKKECLGIQEILAGDYEGKNIKKQQRTISNVAIFIIPFWNCVPENEFCYLNQNV